VVTSLSTSSTWNCSGGVPLTSVDVNGNTTTYSYGSDPFWRPVSITNNATGAVTNYAYQTSSSNTSSTSMNFNGTTSTNTVVTTYDSLGRTLLQQTQQGQSSSSYDTVATAYDSIGRVAKQTLPYSGTLGNYVSTNPGSTTTYDALSRKTQVADSGGGTKSYTYSQNDVLVTVGPQVTSPATENLKKRNLEYNGAGWLASVCEVVTSTLPAGGTCGQTSSYTGYLTKYTYDGAGRLTQVKQNAQSSSVQTRTVAYDELGRKTSESIPEWSAGTGAAGTTNYYYDSVSGCTSSTGDLIKTVDPIGNATCITYDLLHRPTSSQVVSGSYASVTPLMYVVYDAATYSGTGMQNVKGQVAEAYTCSSSTCSSRLTDIFFSASPVTTGNMTGGVLSQMWEKTPNSGNYFLTQDTYFPNGAVGAVSASLGGSSIGIPSLTYGVDGEGRPYSATDTTNSLNLVTATAYNPASSPTSITYGNASTGSASDVDSFTYDSYTYRPTNITYAVNPNPSSSDYTVSTGLTWNANWSLQQMQYTDRNDSTKNQTCTYSADDLSRIASVNCSGAWGQTFAYDPFGNINKTGNNGGTSYAAAYNTVTNQVSSGVTASYDANGNQLTSTPATLTWNALNLPIQVNSTTATYDALGRMVEKGLSGVYTQFVYRPSGAMLAVYSGGLTKGTISLPGGSTAVYNTTGLNYIRHKDWLGSSRLATTWSTHGVYSKEAYAPFGESYNEAGTADRSFTGQDQNVATGPGGTGAYDFLFRKYDPSAGRWLSPDPTGWDVVNQADPQSLDRYAYVENRPVNWVDPYGLSPPCNGGLVSGEEDDEGGWPEVSPYLYVNWNSQNVPQDVPQFNCYNPWNPGNPTGTNSGAGGAPNNGKSKTACTVDNALAAVPGAAPNGINTPVNGHLEVGIDVSAATLQADGFQFFQTPFGPNGYRAGNVIISAHVNGSGSELSPASFQNAPNGIVTAQVHFDIFNPSTGLFGIIGHTIWDWLIGHLFAHSATLDPGC
jgi:RHS repeat-associated protein